MLPCALFFIAIAVRCSLEPENALDVNLPESTVRLESSERQLFVDDFVIAETVGLRRTLHRPIKKGAVIRPNYPAGEHNVQTRAAPVWDPRAKTYKLVTLGKMYESRDGLHWSESGSGPHIPKHMVYDGAAPDPGRRFKGLRMRALFKVEEVLDTRGRVKPGKELCIDGSGGPGGATTGGGGAARAMAFATASTADGASPATKYVASPAFAARPATHRPYAAASVTQPLFRRNEPV